MPLVKHFMQFLKPIAGKRLAVLSVTLAFLMSGMAMPHAAEIVVTVDRTGRDWSDLAMGPPCAGDDADQSQNPNAVLTYVPAAGADITIVGQAIKPLPQRLPPSGIELLCVNYELRVGKNLTIERITT